MARARAGKRAAVDWDAVGTVTLPELTPAGAAELTAGEQHDGLEFDHAVLGDLAADGAQFLECRFASCVMDGGRLRRARFISCELEELRAMTLDMSGSSWTDVALRRGRIGALVAHGAEFVNVTVQHVHLDYLNLRGATMKRVQFVDCRIGELDLSAATLTTVRFPGCQIGRLVVHGCQLEEVDLRSAEFAGVDGVAGLAGATISEAQLGQLAPALAAHLEIGVLPPGHIGAAERGPSR